MTHAAVPLAAPHGVGRRARRRRQRHAPPRRGDAGSSRRPLPRRARRVPAARARRAASAARGARRCGSPGRRSRSASPPTSSSSRAPTRVRAGSGRRSADVEKPSARATDGGCRLRCSTGSTSGSRYGHPAPTTSQASRPATSACASTAAVERQRARLGGTPWRRNAHVPAGALQRFAALDSAAHRRVARRVRGPSADRPWCCPDPPGRADARRSRRRRGDRARAHRRGVAAPGGRAVSEAPTSVGERHGPSEIAAATLACLPDMTPARLRALLRALRRARSRRSSSCAKDGTERAIRRRCDVASAAIGDELVRQWRHAPIRRSPLVAWRRRGTRVWIDGAPDYPILDAVPDRPAVLHRPKAHAPEALRAPRVAVVGTRAATPHGLADARELGATLGDAGVTVVSGLAIGIDGAAHEGALAAGGSAVGRRRDRSRHRVPAPPRDPDRRASRDSRSGAERAGLRRGPAPGPVPRPQPDHRRARRCRRRRRGDCRAVAHGSPRSSRSTTADRARGTGIAAQRGRGRARTRSSPTARIRSSTGATCSSHSACHPPPLVPRCPRRPVPPQAPMARPCSWPSAASARRPTSSRVAPACRPHGVAVAVIELERTGWVERSRGVIWPR